MSDVDPTSAARMAVGEMDGEPSGGGTPGGEAAGIGPSDVLEALFNTEPNPSIESLPGDEAVSYGLRGMLKFASGLLGKQMDIPGIQDTALHDFIRSFVAARDSGNEAVENIENPEGLGDVDPDL